MSKICPGCKRTIDDDVQFCPFCSAFAGDVKGADEQGTAARTKYIMLAVPLAVMLIGAVLSVFVFDLFGLSGADEPSAITGSGSRLFNEGLTPAAKNGEWGYINQNGEYPIGQSFSTALDFDSELNGLAPAAKDGKYGYIDAKGDFAVAPAYLYVGDFAPNGFAAVQDENGRYHYINSRGSSVLGETDFAYAEPYNDSGYAFAFDTKKIKKEIFGEETEIEYSEYYLLSSDGKIVNTLEYGTGIEEINGELYTGFVRDENGTEKYAVFSCESGEQQGGQYDEIYYKDGFILLCSTDKESGLYKVAVTDRSMNELSDKYYLGGKPESSTSGLIMLKKDGERFFKVLLDNELNEVCCEDGGRVIISGFDKSGYACVYEGGSYCGYTAQGKQFTAAVPFGSFNCGLAPFADKSGLMGYINTAGEAVLAAEYNEASEFYADGYAVVCKDGAYQIINASGTVIASGFEYPQIKQSRSDIHWYTRDSFYCHEGFSPTDCDIREVLLDRKTQLADKNDNRLFGNDYTVLKNFGETAEGDAAIYYMDKNKVYLVDKNKTLFDMGDIDIEDSVLINGKAYWYKYDEENGETVFCDRYGNSIKLSGSVKGADGDNFVMQTIRRKNASGFCQYTVYYGGVCPSIRLITRIYSEGVELIGGRLLIDTHSADADDKTYYKSKISVVADCDNGRRIFESQNEISLTSDGFICESTKDDSSRYNFYSPYGKLLAKNGEYIMQSNNILLIITEGGRYELYDSYGYKLGEYDFARMSEKSDYITVRKEDGRYYCLDCYFNEVFSSDVQFMPPVNSYAAYADIETGLVGFLGMDGKTAIKPSYGFVCDITAEGYILYKDNKSAYAADLNGNEVNNARTEYYLSNISSKDNVINGYTVLSFEKGAEFYMTHDSIYGDNKNVCGITASNGAYYDEFDHELFHVFDTAFGFTRMPDGTPVAIVEEKYRYGVIGLDGEYIVKPEYGFITIEDYIICGDNIINGVMIFDSKGNEVNSLKPDSDTLSDCFFTAYGNLIFMFAQHVGQTNHKITAYNADLQQLFTDVEISWFSPINDDYICIDLTNEQGFTRQCVVRTSDAKIVLEGLVTEYRNHYNESTPKKSYNGKDEMIYLELVDVNDKYHSYYIYPDDTIEEIDNDGSDNNEESGRGVVVDTVR